MKRAPNLTALAPIETLFLKQMTTNASTAALTIRIMPTTSRELLLTDERLSEMKLGMVTPAA